MFPRHHYLNKLQLRLYLSQALLVQLLLLHSLPDLRALEQFPRELLLVILVLHLLEALQVGKFLVLV
jgi:hypothetical protein